MPFQDVTSGKCVSAKNTHVRTITSIYFSQQHEFEGKGPTHVLTDVFSDAWHEDTSCCNLGKEIFHPHPLQA